MVAMEAFRNPVGLGRKIRWIAALRSDGSSLLRSCSGGLIVWLMPHKQFVEESLRLGETAHAQDHRLCFAYGV